MKDATLWAFFAADPPPGVVAHVVEAANPLLGAFASAAASRPPAFRADWAPVGVEPRVHVVACPLDEDRPVDDNHAVMRWVTLDEMRRMGAPRHDTAALALATCTSMQAHK